MTKNPWKTLSTREIYKNPWIRVREDQVLTPYGTQGIYGVVEPTGYATGVVALTAEKEIYLVGQYRYATDQYSWEIPEGGSKVGETALEAAKRELREETGLIAEHWEELGGEFHTSNCFTSERAFLYLAQGLSSVTACPDPTEVLAVERVPFARAFEMLESGEIKDSLTIIALLRIARLFSLS